MPNEAPTAETADVDFAALLRNERDGLQAQLKETAERGEAERLAGELRDSLEEVDAALKRLEDGTYGICEVCGKPIGAARLEAMPAARLCIVDAARH